MIKFVFLIFGVLCFFAAVAGYSKDSRVSTALAVLSALGLVLFAGLREIGIDQDSYGYLLYYNLSDGRMSLSAEPTFVLMARIVRFISEDSGFRVLLVFYAFLGVLIKMWAISKISENFWLAFLTYFSYFFFLHEFTQIRAGVASGLVLLSLYWVYHRNLRMFLVIIAIASVFHFSALVALPIYLLRNNFNLYIKIMIAIAIPLGLLFRGINFNFALVLPSELIASKIEVYTKLSESADLRLNIFNLFYLVKYVLLYLLLIFSDRIARRAKYFPLMLQMYALSMFFYIALSFNTAFAMRISEIFGVVEVVLIPTLIYITPVAVFGIIGVLIYGLGNLSIAMFETELIQSDT
ncbi:EpsG family protein [Microcoleus sp. F10-B2]